MAIEFPPFNTLTVREWVSFQRQFDTPWQTASNGAEQISLRTVGIAEGASYYYGFTVPPGRAFVLYRRELALTEGKYHIDVVSASGGYTGGTPALRSTLRAGATQTVQTEILGGVTPVGTITEITNGFIDNGLSSGGGGGSRIEAGGTDSDGVFKIFPEGSSLLRVDQIDGNGPWTANIRIICWELPAEG